MYSAGDDKSVEPNGGLSVNQRKPWDRRTSRLTILGILFLVTGFLGLPLLWVSKSFSIPEKVIWSLINIIYTSVLIAITVAICWWAFRPLFE